MALTPLHDWGEFTLYKGRQSRKVFKLYKENGNAFAIASGDVIRFKIWQTNGSAPDLDIDSVAATANGSVCTIDANGTDDTTPAQITVKFGQDDVDGLDAGEYKGELIHVDDSQTSPDDPAEVAGRGLVIVKGSATGDVGKT